MRISAFTLLALCLALVFGCDRGGDPTSDASSDGGADGSTDDVGDPVLVLPLGDSLTLGFGSNEGDFGTEGGYRLHLAQMLDEAGIEFDFVGSQQNGPEDMADRDHEGHNGFAVAQVREITDAALEEFEPDVVLLMAGTNDQITFVEPTQPPADAADDLEILLRQIDEGLPGVQIITAQVIPLVSNEEGITEYNSLIAPMVEELQGEGVNIRLVDMHVISEENLSEDGIHPTNEGYDLMAEIWYPALLEAIADI